MPFRSRLGAVLLGGLMLAFAAWPTRRPRALSAPCAHVFGLRDLQRGQSLPLVLCGVAPRVGAREILERMNHVCRAAEPDELWLEKGDVLEVRRGCHLRRTRLSAARRLALGMRLDLNRASAEELEALPRIGEGLAQRIVRFRRRHGSFDSVGGLRKVRGIGARTVARIRSHLRCSRR